MNAMTFKVRKSEAGLHLFERTSGLNVLFDEFRVPTEHFSKAPRYVSMALTNACGLRCSYCYAPKNSAKLEMGDVIRWATELDGAGCLGIGFGGGEPTNHPQFSQLCKEIAASTSMAVTFTTHGHRLTADLADALRGSVHFVRLSVDGVGATYERLRRRSFSSVLGAAGLLRSVSPFGINMVVNADTISELDDIVAFANDVGASELLLLPEQRTSGTSGISMADSNRLVRWIETSDTHIRLAISRSGLEGLVSSVEVIPNENSSSAHLHVDAAGVLRPNAYSPLGENIGQSIMDAVHALKEAM